MHFSLEAFDCSLLHKADHRPKVNAKMLINRENSNGNSIKNQLICFSIMKQKLLQPCWQHRDNDDAFFEGQNAKRRRRLAA